MTVYIVMLLSRTFYELIGVYSSQEKAKAASEVFLNNQPGSSKEEIFIIERDVL